MLGHGAQGQGRGWGWGAVTGPGRRIQVAPTDSQRLQARQLPQRLGGDPSQLVVLQHPVREERLGGAELGLQRLWRMGGPCVGLGVASEVLLGRRGWREARGNIPGAGDQKAEYGIPSHLI